MALDGRSIRLQRLMGDGRAVRRLPTAPLRPLTAPIFRGTIDGCFNGCRRWDADPHLRSQRR